MDDMPFSLVEILAIMLAKKKIIQQALQTSLIIRFVNNYFIIHLHFHI